PGIERLVDHRLVDPGALPGVEQGREPWPVGLGQLQRADQAEPEHRAIQRAVVDPAELLLARERRLEVAVLEAGPAVLVLLAALLGPPDQLQRSGHQPRALERVAAVEVDARSAALLGAELLQLVDRLLDALVAGLRRPVLDLAVERIL